MREEKLTSPHHEFINVLMGPDTINSKDNERNTEEAAKNDPNSLIYERLDPAIWI